MSIVSTSRQSCAFSATRRIIHYPLMSYGNDPPEASTHDPSPDTRADLRRVERARRKLEDGRVELTVAIIQAWRSGESYADIGRAAQMSKQRVGQIIKEARP